MTIESNKNKLPKARLEKLTIAELSLVDRPCQEPATVALMKRVADIAVIQKRGLLTSAEEGHSHLLDDQDGAGAGYTSCECMGEGNDATYHSHPWSRDDAGNIVIGMSAGHSHVPLDPANTDAAATEVAMRALAPHAKSTRSPEPAKVNDMKLVVLTEAQHAHYSKLAPADAEAFAQKTSSERDADVAKSIAADPEVYKTAAGIVIRKSHGDVALMLAKQADENAEKLAKATEIATTEKSARETVELTKRADTMLAVVKADDGSHVELLRAVEAIADTAKRDAATKALKLLAANTRLGKSAPGAGGLDAPSLTAPPPVDALTAHVTKYQADHKIATYEQAFNKALTDDPEAKRLYNASRN